FAIESIGFGSGLSVPVFSAALEAQVFVEAPVARFERQLSPFATLRRDVAGLFEDDGHHRFVGGLEEVAGVVAGHAGAKSVAASHEQRARWTAQGSGIGMVEAQAGFGEGVEVGRLEVVGAVATDVADAKIVGEDEDDVWFGWCAVRETTKQCQETSEQD
ncbi:MAG: hypothetical protein JWO95_2321, partial [Verrucomicrobiales bacterium]|nr:hypothetical protein [Verrucomicrobiales bacterium]